MNETWITWERPSHSRSAKTVKVTRLASEPKPNTFTDSRPATREEIETEKQNRADSKARQEKHDAFKARPEYVPAKNIGACIEFMDADNHPLDRLTLQEWQELETKLLKR